MFSYQKLFYRNKIKYVIKFYFPFEWTIIICQGIRDQNNSKSDNNKRGSSRYTKINTFLEHFPCF